MSNLYRFVIQKSASEKVFTSENIQDILNKLNEPFFKKDLDSYFVHSMLTGNIVPAPKVMAVGALAVNLYGL